MNINKHTVVTVLSYMATVFFIVAVWHVYIWWGDVPAFVLASPESTGEEIWHLFSSGDAWIHIRRTLGTLLAGLILGSSIGIILGVALEQFRKVGELLSPYILFFQAVPKIALAPLFLIWFGLGQRTHILLASSLVFFPIMESLRYGLRTLDPEFRDLGSVLGLSRRQTLFRIELPASGPPLIAGLRVAVIQATIGAVLAEWISGKVGLGTLMIFAGRTFNTPLLMATISLTVGLSVLLFVAVSILERRTVSWWAYRPTSVGAAK